jgi:hypothetical protein
VELSSDPLNRELLEEKNSRAEEDGEKNLFDQVDCVDTLLAGVGLLRLDQWFPSDPDDQTPDEKCDVPVGLNLG